jgi:hypothetical protein
MATIKKDTAITSVTISKVRKKLTSFGYDPSQSIIYITYDRIALDYNGNEVYILDTNNVDQIPQSRFGETLIAEWITASRNMILNEF